MEGVAGRQVLAPDRLDRPFPDPLVGRIFPPLATGVHWGLDRTELALEALGDPHRAYATLHVGGTNGKGSVTSMLGAILQRAGHGAACYTSPHLCSFRERILINGSPLSEQALLSYAGEILDPILRFGLTFFEAVTVLAMHAFAREGVTISVMEVGLGGRLDATNVVLPEVSAVTNVEMDHADFLGETLPEIAREKAGIMKAGVPFVTTEQSPGLLRIFREMAREVGAPFTRIDPPAPQTVDVTPDHTHLEITTRTWGHMVLRTPLLGSHQATNAVLAVEVLEHLDRDFKPEDTAIIEGMAAVRYHGRNEIMRIGNHTWLLDLAHNTAGIASLVDTIDRLDLPRPIVAVVGVLGDKDWRTMLPGLLSRTDAAILTQPPSAPHERHWDPFAAADQVDGLTVVRVVEDFVCALENAKERALGGTVVVTGSVHTVGSAMNLLGLDPLRG